MSIYHAYDIRGEFPKELNEKITYKIARAFVILLKQKTVVVGRDARISSNSLHKAFVKGLIDQGTNVIDIGLCTTPILYFGVANYKYDSGIMITASHLPKQFNGIKLFKKNSVPISYESGLNKIEALVKQNKFSKSNKGKIIKKNILREYKKFILKNTKKTNLKVIVDAGNMMGAIDGKILSKIADMIPMFFKIDPTFPNREPDTSKEENLNKLRCEVLKHKTDLGIAFDGDADRVAFIDNKGRIIQPAIVSSLLLSQIAKPDSTIIQDVTLSKTLQETAKKYKIRLIMSRVGHTYVSLAMRKYNALFGVERSGHYFFKENFYMDSGLLTAVKLIQLLDKSKQPISNLINEIHTYPSYIVYIKTKDKDKLIHKLANSFSKNAKKILKIDGISIYHEDFWLNIRKSNTENVVKVTIEADNYKKLNEIKNKFNNY